jgi:hypothetical protein
MILKGLQEKLKRRSGEKFLKQELKAPGKRIDRSSGISSLGCIVDLDQFGDANVFYDFVDEFSLRSNAVKIIGYKSYYDKNSPYATPVFSDKDLGWKGNIENGYALEFLNREYDLLINYYAEEKLLLQLMTLKAKTRIKVGFGGVNQNLNDLIINTSLQDFKTFKAELKKYLIILNEIR